MSEHCGYVVRVENLRSHSNADRLQIATFFGNDTCVGLDVVQGEIGIYFPSDLQLSVEFCDENHTVGEYVKEMAEQYYDGADPIGKTHIREGVVIRIVNRPKFTAFKHKNYSFKMLEGLIKETASAPDLEEAEDLK